MAKRMLYWYLDDVSPPYRDKALYLRSKGIEVRYLSSWEDLMSALGEKRVGVIMVSAHDASERTRDTLHRLTVLPELSGVKLILSVSSETPETMVDFGFGCGFRDIIPFDLENSNWMSRFLFAIGNKDAMLPPPIPQVSTAQMAQVIVPLRVVWITEDQIRIESRIRPPVGSKLKLKGPIPQAMGLNALNLTVLERHRNRLTYRFSDGLVCSWRVPSSAKQDREIFLAKIKAQNLGPRIKVFMAVQSPALRQTLLKHLNQPVYDISVALQRRSIADDPKYISPDLVFLEDRFCQGSENLDLIRQMFDSIDLETPVIIAGGHIKSDQLRALGPGRRIISLPRIPVNLTEKIQTKYLVRGKPGFEDLEDNKNYFRAEHDYSMGTFTITGRVTMTHPRSAQILVPFEIGAFGLCRIEAPFLKKLLGKAPYGKITETYKDGRRAVNPFPFTIEVRFCDVLHSGRKRISEYLIRLISDRLNTELKNLELQDNVGTTLPIPKKVKTAPPIKAPAVSKKKRVKIDRPRYAKTKPQASGGGLADLHSAIFSTTTLYVAAFLLFFSLVLFTLTKGIDYIRPIYQKSGKNYSEQLMIFHGKKKPED